MENNKEERTAQQYRADLEGCTSVFMGDGFVYLKNVEEDFGGAMFPVQYGYNFKDGTWKRTSRSGRIYARGTIGFKWRAVAKETHAAFKEKRFIIAGRMPSVE